MSSRKQQKNDAFMDAVTNNGDNRGRGMVSVSRWSNIGTGTQGVTTRRRSGSVTEVHMHGTQMGTQKHTDRHGVVTTISKRDQNATTKSFVRSEYLKRPR